MELISLFNVFDLENGFKYDLWANNEVLNQLNTFNIPLAEDLLAHCCAAQKLWLSRINGKDVKSNSVFPQISLLEQKAQFEIYHAEFLDLCSQKDRLSKFISYTNTKGESFNQALSDILFHVIIHGQHHRAQIATLIRQFGAIPKATDYIFYLHTFTSTGKV